MQITYTGGILGLHLLVDALRDEGFEPEYQPPLEQRGPAGDVVVQVVIWLAEEAGGELVGAAAMAAAMRARDRVKARLPRSRVEIDEHDNHRYR